MDKIISQPLFPTELTSPIPPSTRYQGSKYKLLAWIWSQIQDRSFRTCLDVFGGTGVVSHMLKSKQKEVTYNDYLKCNYLCAKAILENNKITLDQSKAKKALVRNANRTYLNTICDNYSGIFFLDEENILLDVIAQNIQSMENEFEKCIAYDALFQACIIKRPYNLFHRANLYMRTAEVERSFGNKTTWDRPFSEHFLDFIKEINTSIFDTGINCKATNMEALELVGGYDLVYLDPPYLNSKGTGVDYADFYCFLEGISNYETWDTNINHKKKHKPYVGPSSLWNDEKTILNAFKELIHNHRDSMIVISYRSDGIPSEDDLVKLLKDVKKKVTVLHYGEYKYVLSKNAKSKEILLIAE